MIHFVRFLLMSLLLFIACTKKEGKSTALALSDLALLDSCKNTSHPFYKNDSTTLYSGSAGPHGNFKLRFNIIAYKSLTDKGKLPLNAAMPEGSLIIKDIYTGGNNITLYAFMYKKSGSWIWGEVTPDKQILYSVFKNPSVCIGCHSQQGNRDLVVSFNFY